MEQSKYFEKIAEYKLLAKHEVGQNFLIDPSSCSKIVDALDLSENDKVLEIGSGAGSLSYFLMKNEADATLLDIDEGLVTKLKEDFASCPNIKPIQANALKYDMKGFTKILGNLPYYITSSLIETILLKGCDASKAVLMVQKEVYPRLASSLKSEGYGPLSILISYRASIKREFNVPRTSFAPMPHVDSLVFSLTFKDDVDIEKASKLYSLLNALFLHRRKTIYNNLSLYLKDDEKASLYLEKTHILKNKRPEELTLNDYLALLDCCEEIRN